MKINVKFSSLLENVTGKSEEEVTLRKEFTVKNLLNVLTEKYGKDFRDLLFTERGQLRKFIHIVVNDKDIMQLGGLEADLKGISQISIIISVVAVSGG